MIRSLTNKLLLLVLLVPSIVFAQRKAEENGKIGQFSFGMRNTLSIFFDDNRSYVGMSVGGNIRFKLGKRIGLESFGDYITTDVAGLAQRTDAHGGFSVVPYFFNKQKTEGFSRIEPFPVTGFCIDYSKFTKIGNQIKVSDNPNEMERYSFAAHFGVGSHFNITKSIDLTILSQYMSHLGTDIDIAINDDKIYFEKQKGGSLEGHLLFTVSLNLVIADLW